MGGTICCAGICMNIPGFPTTGPRQPDHIPICLPVPGDSAAACGSGGSMPCAMCPCPVGGGSSYLPSALNATPGLRCMIA